jgi:hypothetical protein
MLWGSFRVRYVLISRDEDELVAKLVWRVKLVAELEPSLTLASACAAERNRKVA